MKEKEKHLSYEDINVLIYGRTIFDKKLTLNI